jgi:glycerol-3-phosphate dehydrogenase
MLVTQVSNCCILFSNCLTQAVLFQKCTRAIKIFFRDYFLEAADDVPQGATPGNSGIVHAGYDDKPGTNHVKFCWPANQMLPRLDKELPFGYQNNGSLVMDHNEKEIEILKDLMKREETNGIQRLKKLKKLKLHEMEPHIDPNCIAALYSPAAGNFIPCEFTIALAENAVNNGLELRIRREVTDIEQIGGGGNINSNFSITLRD